MFPFVDHVETLDDLQIFSLLVIQISCLCELALHFEGLSGLSKHLSRHETAVRLLILSATKIALTCLLSHLQLFKVLTGLDELLEGFQLFMLK
jgi:hypothetical protein